MKKSLLYITLAALVAAVSCSKNEPPVFDDANAFVAFNRTTASIAEAIVKPSGEIVEQTATLKIPVTLASVKGLQETVKFTVTDGTAKAGKHFQLLTTSGTLAFDAQNRSREIEFKILYDDAYTGDLKFTVELTKPESINLGYNSKCTITISDVNHPLTALLGDYTATSSNGAKTNPWTMTLLKDENDDHMVWFFNIFANAGWADYDTMIYGNVDDDLTTITIPLGQESEYVYSNGNPVVFYGLAMDDNGYDEGNTTCTIIKDDSGNITGLDFGEEYGFWGYIPDAGTIGYAYPRITAVKN